MALKLTFLCNAWLAVSTAADQPVCITPDCSGNTPMSEFSLLQVQIQLQETEGKDIDRHAQDDINDEFVKWLLKNPKNLESMQQANRLANLSLQGPAKMFTKPPKPSSAKLFSKPSYMQEDLPEGWESAVDPDSGRPFFWKDGSDESQWEPPGKASKQVGEAVGVADMVPAVLPKKVRFDTEQPHGKQEDAATLPLEEACSVVPDRRIFEPEGGKQLTTYEFCKACKRRGHIYVAVGELPFKECGVLGAVRITNPDLKLSDTAEKLIHSIDEFHLGQGLPPFRWATTTCEHFRSNMCLRQDTIDHQSNQPIWWQGSEPAGFWSRRLLRRWEHWIEPGSNVVDIGANVGDTTIEMALRAKTTVAVEAIPKAMQFLEINAGLNPWLDIRTHHLAISDQDGIFTKTYDGFESTVPQKAFSKFLLSEYGEDFVRQISLIKISTEGGLDRNVLRGYKPLLSIKKPVFYVEWFDPWWKGAEPSEIPPDFKDFFLAIAELGYTPVNPQTGKVVDSAESGNDTTDLILLPPSKTNLIQEKPQLFNGFSIPRKHIRQRLLEP